MKNVSLTIDAVRTIENYRDAIASAMVAATNNHAAAILQELDAMSHVDSVSRARHALVFSIVSPRCPFSKNVAVTPVIVRMMIDGVRDASAFTSTLSAFGIGLQNAKGLSLAQVAEQIATMDAATIDRTMLLAMRGVSLKVSAMTLALFDAASDVYTLDVHMIRGIARLAGFAELPNTITDSAYIRLERFMIDLSRELFPQLPVFVTQWAMWNDFKSGQHESHAAIFGL